MTVRVERFTPNPEDGRPKIATFTGREGTLSVHCEDGALWLFAIGPAGGDRGAVVIPAQRAGDVLAWLDAGAQGRMPTAGTPALAVRSVATTGVMLVVVPRQRPWRMLLDPAAWEAWLECVRAWAEAAERLA